jgi:hypothetical protein
MLPRELQAESAIATRYRPGPASVRRNDWPRACEQLSTNTRAKENRNPGHPNRPTHHGPIYGYAICGVVVNAGPSLAWLRAAPQRVGAAGPQEASCQYSCSSGEGRPNARRGGPSSGPALAPLAENRKRRGQPNAGVAGARRGCSGMLRLRGCSSRGQRLNPYARDMALSASSMRSLVLACSTIRTPVACAASWLPGAATPFVTTQASVQP